MDIAYDRDGYVSYVDVNSAIISEFDFTNDYHKPKQEKKIFDYKINGKDVRCELEYNDNLGGYSVMGYTVDKQTNSPDKIQKILEIQGKLLNEINNLFAEQTHSNDDCDIDITDEMY